VVDSRFHFLAVVLSSSNILSCRERANEWGYFVFLADVVVLLAFAMSLDWSKEFFDLISNSDCSSEKGG